MARRPAALALIQPGSSATRFTSAPCSPHPARDPPPHRRLRAEVARGAALRRRSELRAPGPDRQPRRNCTSAGSLSPLRAEQSAARSSPPARAIAESDRALAFGEEARSLERAGTRESRRSSRAASPACPGPRPARRAGPAAAPPGASLSLPVEGRLVTGVGEISDGGVHARGLTFEAAAGARVSPRRRPDRLCRPFRGYGNVVIIDHGAAGRRDHRSRRARRQATGAPRPPPAPPLGRTARAADASSSQSPTDAASRCRSALAVSHVPAWLSRTDSHSPVHRALLFRGLKGVDRVRTSSRTLHGQ